MKPPPFDYVAPTSVAEATQALAGGDAAVLAGGQSLLLDLRWRRLAPRTVVDVNGVPQLGKIAAADGAVRIGALVRHRELEDPASVPGPLGALLAAAAPYIAHPPIRARGTFVGSIGWALPASEWCAIAAAIDATVSLASTAGRRDVGIAAFLTGVHRTARRPDELITGVTLPRLPDDTRVAFTEQRRTHGTYAQLAVAVAVRRGTDGVEAAHIGLANAADRALRASAAEAMLVGTSGAAADIAECAATAARADASPVDEPHADAEYKRHLVQVLVRRTLTRALAEPTEEAA